MRINQRKEPEAAILSAMVPIPSIIPSIRYLGIEVDDALEMAEQIGVLGDNQIAIINGVAIRSKPANVVNQNSKRE